MLQKGDNMVAGIENQIHAEAEQMENPAKWLQETESIRANIEQLSFEVDCLTALLGFILLPEVPADNPGIPKEVEEPRPETELTDALRVIKDDVRSVLGKIVEMRDRLDF